MVLVPDVPEVEGERLDGSRSLTSTDRRGGGADTAVILLLLVLLEVVVEGEGSSPFEGEPKKYSDSSVEPVTESDTESVDDNDSGERVTRA